MVTWVVCSGYNIHMRVLPILGITFKNLLLFLLLIVVVMEFGYLKTNPTRNAKKNKLTIKCTDLIGHMLENPSFNPVKIDVSCCWF